MDNTELRALLSMLDSAKEHVTKLAELAARSNAKEAMQGSAAVMAELASIEMTLKSM